MKMVLFYTLILSGTLVHASSNTDSASLSDLMNKKDHLVQFNEDLSLKILPEQIKQKYPDTYKQFEKVKELISQSDRSTLYKGDEMSRRVFVTGVLRALLAERDQNVTRSILTPENIAANYTAMKNNSADDGEMPLYAMGLILRSYSRRVNAGKGGGDLTLKEASLEVIKMVWDIKGKKGEEAYAAIKQTNSDYFTAIPRTTATQTTADTSAANR